MSTLDDYRQRAALHLKQGAPLVAYDAAAEGLRHFPGDPRLRQLLALSLARSGASRPANDLLQQLVAEGHTDEETVGMLARTFKDLWGRALEPTVRRQHLESAREWYADAYRRSRGYWSGINAATMALLLGRRDEAVAVAREVDATCRAMITEPGRGDEYWVLATLGEAALLMGDPGEAEAWYRRAVAQGAYSFGDLCSTRRNARLILSHERGDPERIDACFPIPRVAVFSGHLIDRPDRPTPRFPAWLEPAVRDALHQALASRQVGFGYSSAANGGDILFLEILRDLGAEQHIILPYNAAQFLEDSVDFGTDGDWATRYGEALQRATRVTTASEQRMLGGARSYEYGFELLDGMAAIRADELDTELVCVAVWDGRPGDGPGGTAAAVEHWRRLGRDVVVVDLAALRGASAPPIMVPAPPPRPGSVVAPRRFEAQVVGLLFADAAGFSKLREEQIPRFVEQYLGTVGRVLADAAIQPLLTNTWGDGLYMVFPSVRATGMFALQLSETLQGIDWTQHGLPATLALRIAVHAGPAYACTDPVTGRLNYLGAHVALAARIEPVTPPGAVYGSGAFAALARAHQVVDFGCTYVGQTPLAKGFGTLPMYVLNRTR